ncbi:hypothetical protein LJC19_04835 [Oxalobacter sp. OttesenSCG-928-P03]|nr:hypothetical protein [Oxalobacter sp. OttesenSCG-928-P03]
MLKKILGIVLVLGLVSGCNDEKKEEGAPKGVKVASETGESTMYVFPSCKLLASAASRSHLEKGVHGTSFAATVRDGVKAVPESVRDKHRHLVLLGSFAYGYFSRYVPGRSHKELYNRVAEMCEGATDGALTFISPKACAEDAEDAAKYFTSTQRMDLMQFHSSARSHIPLDTLGILTLIETDKSIKSKQDAYDKVYKMCMTY